MIINWHGFSCFEIQTKTPSGEVILVVDPYQGTTGLRFPRTLEGQMILMTHDEEDANNIGAVTGEPYVIEMSGEFEVKDVFVFGIRAPLKRTDKKGPIDHRIFRIEAEGMRIAHLGALDRELTDVELQLLSNIDILMIPVGGNRVMSSKTAMDVVAQIEPRVVIPMTYLINGVKEPLGTVNEFCKDLGSARCEEANRYKVSKKDLPEEDMLVVTLTR